jgi:hypothetical protein
MRCTQRSFLIWVVLAPVFVLFCFLQKRRILSCGQAKEQADARHEKEGSLFDFFCGALSAANVPMVDIAQVVGIVISVVKISNPPFFILLVISFSP